LKEPPSQTMEFCSKTFPVLRASYPSPQHRPCSFPTAKGFPSLHPPASDSGVMGPLPSGMPSSRHSPPPCLAVLFSLRGGLPGLPSSLGARAFFHNESGFPNWPRPTALQLYDVTKRPFCSLFPNSSRTLFTVLCLHAPSDSCGALSQKSRGIPDPPRSPPPRLVFPP